MRLLIRLLGPEAGAGPIEVGARAPKSLGFLLSWGESKMRVVFGFLVLCLTSLLAVSCGSQGIDTTDGKAFSDSILSMYDSADSKEQADFLNFFYVAMSGRSDLITMSVLSEEDIPNLDTFFNVLKAKKSPSEMEVLKGMSLKEVVDLGRNLKITYLDGRIQQIDGELRSLEEPASFYERYSSEVNKVTIKVPKEAEVKEGENGVIGEVRIDLEVINDSDLPLVDIQKAHHGEPWVVELILLDDQTKLSLNGSSLKNDEGESVFEGGGGVAPHDTRILKIIGDISDRNWAYPPESPVIVNFPEGFQPCLEGWEGSFEAEDSFKRVTELERTKSYLNKQLKDTKVAV
jgi:hypothetical protein